MSNCSEYDRLSATVDKILKDLIQTTTLGLELFRAKEHKKFKQMDKELELLIGEKERAIGALRQHAKDHGCQSAV